MPYGVERIWKNTISRDKVDLNFKVYFWPSVMSTYIVVPVTEHLVIAIYDERVWQTTAAFIQFPVDQHNVRPKISPKIGKRLYLRKYFECS